MSGDGCGVVRQVVHGSGLNIATIADRSRSGDEVAVPPVSGGHGGHGDPETARRRPTVDQ
jgi:hypothetical protein